MIARAGNATDAGRMRSENEDYFGDFLPGNASRGEGRLLIVADGVGGHRSGRLASRLAVDVVAEAYYQPLADRPPESEPLGIDARLIEAFREANKRMYRKSLEDPSMRGMAAACTAAVLSRQTMYGAHVGDTRLYLVRGGTLRQLTRDHSAVQDRIDRGLMKEEERAGHPDRNLITRSLGFEPEVQPDLLPPLRLEAEDRLLLCSDGLHGVVPATDIHACLLQDDPQEAAEQLIRAANERGGPDNITVQVVRLEAFGEERS